MPLSPTIRVVAPLAANVATMTKANEVTEVICLFRNGEVCKANDVMYVKMLAIIGFSYAALLAGVIVPLPSAATLTLPVCAVIALVIAALPVVVIRATMPLVSTISRAEAETPRTFERSGDTDMIAALFAIVFIGWLGGRSWRYQTLPTRFLIARLRADCYQLGAYLERLSFKHFGANLASMRVVILHRFGAQLIRTFAAACGLTPMLQALRVSEISSFTVGASAFNHEHIIA